MVALIRNIDIAIAYLFDVTVLGHNFSVLSLIGSSLVGVATVGGGLKNALSADQSEDEKTELEMDKEQLIG